ncbi:gas vesicle protein GvpL/GvpF [Kribbella amoyensis]|uniref:Gas vesicle protein GvpL/GvpF n=1 Tax=Kribbella amoyensis TaxID=996641 RepID=A0A561BS22_9ACTN|nr:GvpL/GvpF family gas vesicle protein [Kribbella amoyensis]TWD81698.1 gas vesicle protein GvpL/GvpF [Kribbella amoyensis]
MTITTDRRTGCYLYGIAAAGLDLPKTLTGLDDEAVEVIPHGEVAAITSPVSTTRPLTRRADLVAHGRVLDAAAAAGPVLPVRFGSVLEDRDQLLAEVLEPGGDEFAPMLRELAGSAQYTIRVRYDEARVLAEVVAENPEIAQLRLRTRDRPEHAAYHDRVRLGELVARALEAKQDEDADAVLAVFEPLVLDARVRDGAGLDQVIDVAYLVRDDQRPVFEQTAEQLAKELAGRARVKLVGPSAAYDFVAVEG